MNLIIPKDVTEVNLANIIFVLFFPGYFFYNYAVAQGYGPAWSGGYVGNISIISFIILFPISFVKYINSKGLVLVFSTAFILLMGLIGFWAETHYLIGSPLQHSIEALEGALRTIVLWFIFFSLGYFFFPRKWFGTVLYACFLAMAIIVLLNFDRSRIMFIAKEQFAVNEGVASYQGFARSFIVTAILLLGLSNQIFNKVALTMISLLILYILGARSEFFGFLFVIMITGSFIMTRSSLFVNMLLLLAFISLMVLFIWLQGTMYSNRQFEVLKLYESSSISKRIELFQEGWLSIKKSPILGDYAGQLREGSFGSYIHNVLSAWRQFGILSFGLFLSLALTSLFISVRKTFLEGNNGPLWEISLYLNFYTFFLMVTSKSVFDNIAPLAWGFTMSAFFNNERDNSPITIGK